MLCFFVKKLVATTSSHCCFTIKDTNALDKEKQVSIINSNKINMQPVSLSLDSW